MKVDLSFEEILALLRKKLSQLITLQYVAPDTVAVQTTVKIKFIQKDVALNLRIIKIEGTNLSLSYEGGLGVDIALSLLLRLMDADEKYGVLYEKLPNNQLIIHLDKIPQLQSVLTKVVIQNIRFVENAAIAYISIR